MDFPSVVDSTGISKKHEAIEMLDGVQVKQDVIALDDTTASNTGIRNDCGSLIEKDLNHPLLCLAFHHHVYEVHIQIFGSPFRVTTLTQRVAFLAVSE